MTRLARPSTTILAVVLVSLLTTANACDPESLPEEEEVEEPLPELAEDTTDSAQPEESPAADPAGAKLAARMEAGIGTRGTAHVSMRIQGPQVLRIEGDTSYAPKSSASDVRISSPDLGDKPARLILVGDDAFMALPGFTPPGKWFVVPTNNDNFGSLVEAGGAVQLDDFTAGFEEAATEVTPRGEKTLDGQTFEAFQVRIDPDQYLDALGEVPDDVPRNFTVELLLDDQDRPRRMSYDAAGSGVVLDMTKWGEPVDIDAPPKGDRIKLPARFR